MESDAYSMLLKKHYDALKHLKEANVNAELLLQQRPDAFDAYVALGCANYIIGSLPGSARSCFGSAAFTATNGSAWSRCRRPLMAAAT